jgi:hypothetical protein
MDCVLKSLTTTEAVEERRLFLRPDDTKKSVFWLDLDATETTDPSSEVVISAPAECRIKRSSSSEAGLSNLEDQIFAWGGFQMTSNSKAVEVYFTAAPSTANASPKESYLTSLRGIPVAGGDGLFKVLCAVPGGARPVLSVRFKLLSLQPKGADSFSLSTLKWTARIAVAPPKAAASKGHSAMDVAGLSPSMVLFGPPPTRTGAHGVSPEAPQDVPKAATPFVTKDDLGAAMAGLSFALRSTEDRLVTPLTQSLASQQILQAQVHALSRQLMQQSLLLQQQSLQVQQQQQMMVDQNKLLLSLQNQQQAVAESLAKTDRKVSAAEHMGPAIEATGQESVGAAEESVVENADNSSLWRRYASMTV